MSDTIALGALDRLRPVVNIAHILQAREGMHWGPRTIADCQLLFVLSGRGELELGPLQLQLRQGSCVFYGADSPHRLTPDRHDPFRFASMHFSWDRESPSPVSPYDGLVSCAPEELARAPAAYTVLVRPGGFGTLEGKVEGGEEGERIEISLPHLIQMPELEPIFLRIVHEFRAEEPGGAWLLRGLLTQLLAMLVRRCLNERSLSPSYSKVQLAVEAVRSEPEVHWTSERLADICGYHPTYFAALFAESMGCAPKTFIVRERIRKAKSLLLESGSVEHVALELGYSGVHSFCRSFKSVTGLTPTEFRRRSLAW